MRPARPRQPFITIEGPNDYKNRRIMQQLANFIDGDVSTTIRFSEGMSKLGIILMKDLRDEIELTDTVRYQLRNANLWEHQTDIENMAMHENVTVITNQYVLSNRATFLSKGTVGVEFCSQLDHGLIKPDLQIYLKSEPLSLRRCISLSDRDDEQSRSMIAEFFSNLASKDEEIKTVNYSTNAIDEVIELYKKCVSKDLFDFQFFSELE